MIKVKTSNGHDTNLGCPKLMINHHLHMIVLITDIVLPPGRDNDLAGIGTCIDPGTSVNKIGEYSDEWSMEDFVDFREELVMRNEFLQDPLLSAHAFRSSSSRPNIKSIPKSDKPEMVMELTPEQKAGMRYGGTIYPFHPPSAIIPDKEEK